MTTKAFRWLLVTHLKKFIVALSIIIQQHCQKPMVLPAERIQYGMQSPQEGHYKDFNCSKDATLFIHQLYLILIPHIRN